jgi:uncharacterized protein
VNNASFRNKYGPWAIVTGASDGIGAAFAEQLAGAGLKLVLVARRAERLKVLADRLRQEHGTDTLVIPADLSTAQGLSAVDQATSGLDAGLFVASAGYGTSGPILNADLEQEHAMIEVNCSAVLHQTIVFGRRFAARGRGGIILLASLLGWQGTPNSAHYAATKAYVQSLAEGLRVEWKGLNVDVLSSAPGPVHSGFATRANMRMGAAVSPTVVARQSLNALGRKGTVIPGVLSKLLTYSLAPLPRFLRTRILGRVMQGMTRHQQAEAASQRA